MRGRIKLFAACLLVPGLAFANSTAQTLPFSQNWGNAGLITANDDWANVPGIVGYRGDDITAATGADPQTLVGEGTITVDVNANQTAPNTFATGGVTEFDLADDVIALTGSGTADAPNIIIHLNTTGNTNIQVAYNLRDLDSSVDNAVQPVALQYRVGSSGNFTNLPGGFVADASTGPSLATLVTPVSITLPAAANNQALVQVRIITANAVGNDEWIGIDDISVTGTSGGLPTLTINDVSLAEGNAGTITASFSVSLSAVAPIGGVSFDIATADNSATTADNDYVAKSLTGQTIPAGSNSYSFDVTINGDITVEASETYFVNVTNVTGATIVDGQGAGTITNDDFVITEIHAIQGSGNASPLAGSTVTTRGIVTGVRNNGFFLQTADAGVDADPLTSQGVFVFTSSAPPASAAIGNLVIVTGSVVEFFQLTEISSPSISLLSSGNQLPAAINLTAADGALPSPERYESMRVVPNLTVAAPAGGNENEPNATATSTGNFHGVLPGVARPFREPGVSVLDTFVPAPGVTVFDGNLELIVVQSRGLGGLAMNPNAGDVMTGITGILDFGFGFYKFYPDAGQTLTSTVTPTAVSDAAADEFTVAGFNLFRFFDTINDPAIGDPVLTNTALNNRLGKTAEAICSYLKTPDIIGVVEVENIGVLTQLADTINAGQVPTGNAVPACNTAPNYVPYLVEGNDVGGIDVGFLISTKIVGGGATPRVEVLAVVQENDGELLVNPDNSTSTLNDRPTLRLQAVIHHPNGNSYPVTVMINHMRSLSSVNSTAPESNGWASEGHRVRAKRLKQAESLAKLVHARQVANPNERILLLGDFNAFEFNDGFTDSMGIITGQEVPASQVTLHSGFVVATPLTNMTTVDPANQRYSFTFDGNAQSLDHAVVNEAVLMNDGVRSEHARINADFAVINYGLYGAAPIRVSDHDPVVLYVKPKSFGNIDLSVAVSNPDTNVNAGATTTFTVVGNNLDAVSTADNVSVAMVLDAAITGVTVSEPISWTCAAPVVAAASTTITCNANIFEATDQVTFNVTVPVPVEFEDGDLTLSATISAEQGDTNPANNIGSDFVTVIGQKADLAIRTRGASRIYVGYKTRINTVADNYGPDAARDVAVAITTNGPASAFKVTTVPAGWSCGLDAGYPTARFLCSLDAGATMAKGQRPEFVLTFTAPASMANGNLIVGAGISSSTTDPSVANNENSYSLRIEPLRGISLPPIPTN